MIFSIFDLQTFGFQGGLQALNYNISLNFKNYFSISPRLIAWIPWTQLRIQKMIVRPFLAMETHH